MLLKLLNLPSSGRFHCDGPECIADFVVLTPLRLLEIGLLDTRSTSGSGAEIQGRIIGVAVAYISYEFKRLPS
jgi:hypothetical protein